MTQSDCVKKIFQFTSVLLLHVDLICAKSKWVTLTSGYRIFCLIKFRFVRIINALFFVSQKGH